MKGIDTFPLADRYQHQVVVGGPSISIVDGRRLFRNGQDRTGSRKWLPGLEVVFACRFIWFLWFSCFPQAIQDR